MRILAIHQNFPGQYKHLLGHLGTSGKHEIIGVGQHRRVDIPGVKTILYKPSRVIRPDAHHYLKTTENAVLNGQAVLRVCMDLRNKGFRPDVILGHAGWGETLYLKDVYPDVPLIGYFEFFYRAVGADVGFDPEYPASLDDKLRIRTWNMPHLLALDGADFGQTLTTWQRNQVPQRYHDMIHVIHRPDAWSSARVRHR
ncbi:hypothetical protein [Noviherbaspirillum sedimenti]|uniref:hypothetical protein n=1 Tax=Noviherbaspirillum sedimenti TaxID=2320865 RepID=UPI001F32DFCE|nr:hypothetical protein [Noviherbaspirillum sedimenti]